MPRNSKGKGGEREVARQLEQWWRQLEPQARFVRVPMSGGWVHGDGFDACGDVMTNCRRFGFSVEVKRVQAWSPANLLRGKPSPVWGFWRQCQGDAFKTGREPMLWFRRNREPWLVMLRHEYVACRVGMGPPDLVWTARQLAGVDCGALPVVYSAHALLAHLPDVFAKE